MKITVLVERLDQHGYRASTSQPVAMESEGQSRDEAVERLREQAAQRLKKSELVQVSVPGAADTNLWIKYAGAWKDHPDVDPFLENVAEHRRIMDGANSTR